MNNYEYIVAGLPVLQKTFSPSGKTDADGLIAGIREQLSDKDNAIVDFLLKGYDPEALDHSFYVRALAHKNRFIRSYFEFDLKFRNVRVEYLNKSLGLPERKDTIVIHEEHGDFDEKAELLGVLSGNDILKGRGVWTT